MQATQLQKGKHCLFCAQLLLLDSQSEFCSDEHKNIYERKNSIVDEEINSLEFDSVLREHQRLMDDLKKIKGRLFNEKPGKYSPLFIDLRETGKLLCLVNARFRCERCKTNDALTVHHILTRRLKYFMNFNHYLIQRYYWGNIVCLCVNCHQEFHSTEKDWDESLDPINKKYIKVLKEKFLKQNDA